jgi:hypothetical protein
MLRPDYGGACASRYTLKVLREFIGTTEKWRAAQPRRAGIAAE